MAKTLGYPLGFKEYQHMVFRARPRHRIGDIGFRVGPDEINRFAQRVRVARTFEGIALEGYSENTQVGYDGLQQVLLSHSALELFLPVMFGKGEKYLGKFLPLLQYYDQEKVMHTFRKCDPDRAFWTFFRDRCSEKLQGRLDRCDSGEVVNVFYVSAGIRHIFAHGQLTPSANAVKPKNVRLICDTVSDFVIDFIDQEFYKKLKAYCDENGLNYFGEETGVAGDEVV